MKKFRKPTQEVIDERQEQVTSVQGETESIPVFKERGFSERKANIRSKGKNISDIEHR